MRRHAMHALMQSRHSHARHAHRALTSPVIRGSRTLSSYGASVWGRMWGCGGRSSLVRAVEHVARARRGARHFASLDEFNMIQVRTRQPQRAGTGLGRPDRCEIVNGLLPWAPRAVLCVGGEPQSVELARSSRPSARGVAHADSRTWQPDVEKTVVVGYDDFGFNVGGVFMRGSVLCFPSFTLLWDAQSALDVTTESLAAVQLVKPRVGM